MGASVQSSQQAEVTMAYDLLPRLQADMLVLHDAQFTGLRFWQAIRARRAHVLGPLPQHHLSSYLRRLSDGSYLAVYLPTAQQQREGLSPLLVRVIEYQLTDERLGEPGRVYRLATTLLNPRSAPALALIDCYHERWEVELVIDEIKTHERVLCLVLRSKTPQGVYQELYGIFLAHYAVRTLMAQAALEGKLDPDRLSFTEGLFELTEMIDLALILEPEVATEPLLARLRHQMVQHVLPARRLRINRREVKQVYNKYKPKKRTVPPPEPFEPEDQFLDFVHLLDPLASELAGGGP